MNKKKIIALCIVILLSTLLVIKIYDTNKRYGLPEENWYGIGEGFTYDGLKYTLKDVEVCDEKMFEERFGVEGTLFKQDGALESEKVKYFLITLDIEALSEDYNFDFSQICKYSQYNSSYSADYPIIFQINEKRLERDRLAIGESVEYYMVFSFTTLYYTEEGLEELGEDDIALAIYDYKEECVNYLCKGGILDTNGN